MVGVHKIWTIVYDIKGPNGRILDTTRKMQHAARINMRYLVYCCASVSSKKIAEFALRRHKYNIYQRKRRRGTRWALMPYRYRKEVRVV